MPETPPGPNPVHAALLDVERSFAEAGPVELTILMPCLNEAETLGTCIDKANAFLARTRIRGEVVVADNGSTDGSQAIARARGARVAPVESRGYGAALLGGIKAARGRYVIMGDSDDSYDFGNLDAFVEKLRDGFELVMGNRFRGGITRAAMPPLHRYLGNPVLSFIGRLFFRSPIGDFHCGLRGVSREAILGLKLDSPGMEFASEMVVKATIAGLRMAEVPTTLSPDGRSRPPHLRSWRDGWRHLKLLLVYAPRWLFLYPGAALFSCGTLIVAALLGGPIEIGSLTLDNATLLFAVAAVLVGTQMVLFYAVAKAYAVSAGLLPPGPRFRLVREALGVDRLCLIGGLSFAVGFLIASVALARWMASGFGDLDATVNIRLAAVSTLAMAFGIQCVTTGFLLGLAETAGKRGMPAQPEAPALREPAPDEEQSRSDAA